jgi:hypothetical protein
MLDSSVCCLTVRGAVCLKVTTLCFLGVALLTGYPLPCLPNSLCVEQDEKVWLPWNYREVLKQAAEAAALQITFPSLSCKLARGTPHEGTGNSISEIPNPQRAKAGKEDASVCFLDCCLVAGLCRDAVVLENRLEPRGESLPRVLLRLRVSELAATVALANPARRCSRQASLVNDRRRLVRATWQYKVTCYNMI